MAEEECLLVTVIIHQSGGGVNYGIQTVPCPLFLLSACLLRAIMGPIPYPCPPCLSSGGLLLLPVRLTTPLVRSHPLFPLVPPI